MDRRSIVLVEDNPDDQFLAVRALSGIVNKTAIHVLHDGQEALDCLLGSDSGPPTIDLDSIAVILLDIKLPKINGLEVLKALRSSTNTRWIPVVMITSTDEPHELADAYRFGASSYLTKPIDYGEFKERMEVLANYWLNVNSLPSVESGECHE
ncbi:response regulator [Marinobacter sp. DUT-1]|uniref:response regulator n=1 Tax=Marinobacter sp. DUT-1 TaxID=3412037 RepID=UPI003D17B7E1